MGFSWGDSCQNSRLYRRRQLHGFELFETGNQQMPVDPDQIALSRADPQIDPSVLGLTQERLVETGEPVLVDFTAEPLLHLEFALPPELPGDEVAGAGPDATGDVVAGDVKDLALIGDAADHHMGVRVPGIVMIDGYPIDDGIQVLLHLPHQPAREGSQASERDTILGSNNEAELVAVLGTALGKALGIGLVLHGRVGTASARVDRDTFTLQVAQMCSDGLALHTLELDDPRFDDDAAGSKAHA